MATNSVRDKRPTFGSLSFVLRGKKGGQNSDWNLPPPPDNYVEARCVNSDGTVNSRDIALYGIGCDQGVRAAREYLSFLAQAERPSEVGGYLQHIVLGMIEAPRDDLLRGQVVGFFSTVEMKAIG